MLGASRSLWTGFFLTRKRSQVQTLSRPPPFSQVKALLAPSLEHPLHTWAALGPRAHLAVKLVGPAEPVHSGVRLHDNHGE
jgi:hypothetical protein